MENTTLGSYRIEAKVGSGGMGVVYRALDSRLGRKVALKVLPSSALADAGRERRLIQEARATSALNHPNIVTIYEVASCEQDGQSASFIAMEFVPGATLAQLIKDKRLRPRDELKYAVQIADAMAAAHAAGIIHRDLKPSNVMVTPQGLVKILDFGLAKLNVVAQPDAYAETMVGGVGPLTEEGLVLGTVAYISPEQAEGRALDARSDIFSFGSVLYEMITGRQAFPGTSKLSSLSAVLNREPRPLSESVPGVPPDLDQLVGRCLKKSPDRRWQHMADVKVALEEILEQIESGKQPASKTPKRARPMRATVAWLALALLGGLALAIPVGGHLWQKWFPIQPPSFQRLTFRRGDVTSAKFGPSGVVVFSAEWDGGPSTLFSTLPGNREARPLGLPSGSVLSISSTGEMALLLGGGPSGTLARAPVGGGAPRQVLEDVSGADWGPDGTSLAIVRTLGGKHRLEYPIGTVLYETDVRPPSSPRVSPDGRLVAFLDYDKEVGDYSVCVVGPGRSRQILTRGWRGTGKLNWSPNGKEIWFSAVQTGADPTLYAVNLSGGLRIIDQAAGWIVLQDLSREGSALINSVNSRLGISYLPANGPAIDLSWFDASLLYQISEDGKSVLFLELSALQGRNAAIYLRGTDGSPAVLLGYGNAPSLSPDGKWVLCIHRDPGQAHLVLLPTGAGEPRTLLSEQITYETAEWFPNGTKLLVNGAEPGRPVRSWVYDLGNESLRPLTAEGVRATRVSPDGRFYVVSDQRKVLISPLSGGSARKVANLEGGEAVVRWSGDRRFLFLRRTEGAIAQIFRLDVATGQKQSWRTLRVPELGAEFLGPVALSADGTVCAASFQHDLANLYLVRNLR